MGWHKGGRVGTCCRLMLPNAIAVGTSRARGAAVSRCGRCGGGGGASCCHRRACRHAPWGCPPALPAAVGTGAPRPPWEPVRGIFTNKAVPPLQTLHPCWIWGTWHSTAALSSCLPVGLQVCPFALCFLGAIPRALCSSRIKEPPLALVPPAPRAGGLAPVLTSGSLLLPGAVREQEDVCGCKTEQSCCSALL